MVDTWVNDPWEIGCPLLAILPLSDNCRGTQGRWRVPHLEDPWPNLQELFYVYNKLRFYKIESWWLASRSSLFWGLRVGPKSAGEKHLLGAPLFGMLLTLSTNIRLVWKGLPWTNHGKLTEGKGSVQLTTSLRCLVLFKMQIIFSI